MIFTIDDQIIIKCSRINKKYETNPFWGQSFNGLKRLTEKVTAVASLTRVRLVVDHTMPTPLQRSTKLKTLQWYFDQCFYPIKISSCVKNVSNKCFLRGFFHSHPFNEVFIVNGKSHCCNDTYWCLVNIAASKEYLRRIQIIFMLLE